MLSGENEFNDGRYVTVGLREKKAGGREKKEISNKVKDYAVYRKENTRGPRNEDPIKKMFFYVYVHRWSLFQMRILSSKRDSTSSGNQNDSKTV